MTRTGLIAVVLVLLVGSAAAFAWTERLKLEQASVSKPLFDRHFSPTCDCGRATTDLSFVLRHGQRIDVAVVDEDGDHVATLATNREAPRGRVSFDWDGRGDAGQVVPDGIYRLKVRLHGERRTILIPSTIHVDTTAPHAHVVSVETTEAGPGLAVRYTSDETARPLLRLDGKVVLRGKRHRPGNVRLRWDGPLPPGSHEVTLVLVDQAGNRSEPTQPVLVGG